MKTVFITTLILAASTALADGALSVKSPGRAPEAKLKVKSSKVPTFNFTDKSGGKVKTIPLLDIGEESRLSASDLAPIKILENREVRITPIQRKISPEVVNVPGLKELVGAPKAKTLTSPESIGRIPEVKSLATLPDAKVKDAEAKPEKIQEMSPNDYKLLQALIFLEIHKNYNLAMGLFAELLEDPQHRQEALYQYALTAKGLGLNSEFREYMLKVAKEGKNKEWKVRATQALVDGVDVLEVSDIKHIDPLVQQTEIDVTTKDYYHLVRAKYYLDAGKLTEVDESLALIPQTSPHYIDSLLVSGLFNYRRGKLDDAISDLNKAMALSDKKWPLRSVAAITLARMHFQKSEFKDAFQAYLQIDKSDALWLQGMVEQAWTQILSEDYEGAAGNMFSLHTDFFKNAFSPESYVVRTVGYLNLCQYGDGMQVLGEMKKKYTPWKKKMEDYRASHKQSTAYYETVRNWIKNSDLKEVDGLPRSFIVELARHPGFLKIQGQINNYEDEITRFNNISMNLVKIEREILQKQNEIIKTAKTPEERERSLMPLRIEHHIAKKARTSITNLRTAGIKRIEKEKATLRDDAAQALAARFKEVYAALDRTLEQNEVLQYEVYSGAGEHMRYQMAGGDVNNKERAELKVKDGKSLNWKFKGEIWEDEVGHYRSSLKNVCAQEQVAGG